MTIDGRNSCSYLFNLRTIYNKMQCFYKMYRIRSYINLTIAIYIRYAIAHSTSNKWFEKRKKVIFIIVKKKKKTIFEGDLDAVFIVRMILHIIWLRLILYRQKFLHFVVSTTMCLQIRSNHSVQLEYFIITFISSVSVIIILYIQYKVDTIGIYI